MLFGLSSLLSSISQVVFADPLCFSLAENYYEQLYCELKALGQGRDLPSFRDFRNNDETTQALLLKRPAKKVGITVAIAKRPHQHQSQPQSQQQSQTSNQSSKSSINPGAEHLPEPVIPGIYPGLAGCHMGGASILCDQKRYEFTGNRSNSQLSAKALTDENLMGIPPPPAYQGVEEINEYLKQAYQVYLLKMLEIGLGGVTMNFNKFSYFYQDISDKGVSFNGRFETMYKYLKKDKQHMAVSKTPAPDNSVALSDCFKVAHTIIACNVNNKNYLYIDSE